jgi:hypothetical protein
MGGHIWDLLFLPVYTCPVVTDSQGDQTAQEARSRRLTHRQKDDRLQAIRHGELAGEELQAEVISALTETERILTETPIDGALLSNGWSERRAHRFAAQLAVIKTMVEDGRYRANSRYPELSLTETTEPQFDPKTRDALQDAILELQSLLRAASLQSHPK